MDNIISIKKSYKPEIFQQKDGVWTTSLDIAEKFEKRHDNVIRDIENLFNTENQDSLKDSREVQRFQLLNFEELEKKIPGGKQKYYIISKDGFAFIMMSFTGKKATSWKIKYIDAFNKMEKIITKKARSEVYKNISFGLSKGVSSLKAAVAEYESAYKLAQLWYNVDPINFAFEAVKKQTGIDLEPLLEIHHRIQQQKKLSEKE